MIDALLDALAWLVGAALCGAAIAALWWERGGRRGWEADLRRREDRDHRERMRRPRR